jgi:hypothetical protein
MPMEPVLYGTVRTLVPYLIFIYFRLIFSWPIFISLSLAHTQTHTYMRARQTHAVCYIDPHIHLLPIDMCCTATLFRNRQITQKQHLLCIKYIIHPCTKKNNARAFRLHLHGYMAFNWRICVYECVLGSIYWCVCVRTNFYTAENGIVFSHCDSLNRIYIMPGIGVYSEFRPSYSVLNSHFGLCLCVFFNEDFYDGSRM